MSWSSGADITSRRSWLAVLAVVAIAGCTAPGTGGPPASPRVSCVGVPQAKCDEAVASVARSLPNTIAVSIEVTCVSGTCTPESGAMDTVVTVEGGGQLRSSTVTWSEPGAGSGGGVSGPVMPVPAPAIPPTLPVEPTCQGVPLAMCRSMAESAFSAFESGGQAVVGIVVRCSDASCTDKQGSGDTTVTYADGTTRSSSWQYAGS